MKASCQTTVEYINKQFILFSSLIQTMRVCEMRVMSALYSQSQYDDI